MDVERIDFVSFLTEDIPRAKRFYSEVLKDPDGNALMRHRRYAPFADGRQP